MNQAKERLWFLPISSRVSKLRHRHLLLSTYRNKRHWRPFLLVNKIDLPLPVRTTLIASLFLRIEDERAALEHFPKSYIKC
jgi:hypothetical protein